MMQYVPLAQCQSGAQVLRHKLQVHVHLQSCTRCLLHCPSNAHIRQTQLLGPCLYRPRLTSKSGSSRATLGTGIGGPLTMYRSTC